VGDRAVHHGDERADVPDLVLGGRERSPETTAKSASFPGSIDPFTSSSNVLKAASFVYRRSASCRVIACSGPSTSPRKFFLVTYIANPRNTDDPSSVLPFTRTPPSIHVRLANRFAARRSPHHFR